MRTVMRLHTPRDGATSALLRLSRLAPLDPAAVATLEAKMAESRVARARRELLVEGQEISEPKLILSGWAARARVLSDGRRQFLSFLLPGDLIGLCRHARPLAVSSVVALTDVSYCAAPPSSGSAQLAQAYAVSMAMEEANLLGHITRLGRFNAQERISDLLLELHERLSMAGLVVQDGFDLPLTQETLADALGLTSVHVNRMLQLMRREGDLHWKSGRVTLLDPKGLAARVGRMPVKVSAIGG